MRSFYEHIQMDVSGAKKKALPRPIYRSSAIFPAINRPGISSRILFMGYWILKRHIKQIASIVTLRSETGEILVRKNIMIEEAKTYRLELNDLLKEIDYSSDSSFTGTMEVEFFSTANLFFPYPAVVINYYGPNFSTVVHTAQRTYNDFEDMRNNTQSQVPESGFNIHVDDDHEPFIGLINGPEGSQDMKIQMEFFNSDDESISYDLDLGPQKPYQLQMIFPAKHFPLKEFFKRKVGAGKIRFKLHWIFPRLVVGNIQHSLNALSITHSYYDCTSAKLESDYWLPTLPEWYPASLMLPVTVQGDDYTNVYFYPIYSPTEFMIDVEIYDAFGKCIGKKRNVLQIKSPSKDFLRIDMKSLCQELKISLTNDLSARVYARVEGENRFPARVKLAIDVGAKANELPCNICANLQPFNPALEDKSTTFCWAPILADQPNSSLWIMNSAPNVNYKKEAEIHLTFFREKDNITIMRDVKLAPHGFVVIRPTEDLELKQFFGNEIGWCTATSNNPYTTTYYFANNPSGVVGGDHGF
jgi:hypothetical protein